MGNIQDEDAPRARSTDRAAGPILLCALPHDLEASAMRALADGHTRVRLAESSDAAPGAMKGDLPSVILVGGTSAAATAEACKRLRAIESWQDAVIVAVGREGDIGTLLEGSPDDFFVETSDQESLRNRLLVARRHAAYAESRRSAERHRRRRSVHMGLQTAQREEAQAKMAEDALYDLTESLTITLDSIGDGVIATNLTGIILRMNPVAQRLTGWTLAEAVGTSLLDVLHIVNADTRLPVENPIRRALGKGVSVNMASHTLLIRRDGSELPIADSCAPIKGHDGSIRGTVLVFRDLTEQRNAEAMKARLQSQLAVADRLASVGTLAAGAAHEINNPLSYAMSNIELAIEEASAIGRDVTVGRTKEVEHMLAEAREGITRVAKIVRALKTYSRGEEDRPKVVDIESVLDLSIKMAFHEIGARARLAKTIGKMPLVEVDGARLGQVFINLLVNAAHAVAEGDTAKNEIRVVTSTDDRGRAVIEVSDNGVGIPLAIQSRVFDLFFTTKPIGAGTGLGLAICHSFITAMGGEIVFDSVPGEGTVFRVILPPARVQAIIAKAAPRAPTEGASRSGTVLVVDDEPMIGRALVRILRGHDVTVVTSARDALDLLHQGKRFDVVLSDLMMPEMSGMELFAEMVKLYPSIASRVVFITGGTCTAQAHAFLENVDNERLQKPFEANTIRDLVQKLLSPESEPIVDPSARVGRDMPSGSALPH